jgi:hypothetical protein
MCGPELNHSDHHQNARPGESVCPIPTCNWVALTVFKKPKTPSPGPGQRWR